MRTQPVKLYLFSIDFQSVLFDILSTIIIMQRTTFERATYPGFTVNFNKNTKNIAKSKKYLINSTELIVLTIIISLFD